MLLTALRAHAIDCGQCIAGVCLFRPFAPGLPLLAEVMLAYSAELEKKVEELEDPPEIMVDTLKACEVVYILADRRLTDADFYRVQALGEAFKNGKAKCASGCSWFIV